MNLEEEEGKSEELQKFCFEGVGSKAFLSRVAPVVHNGDVRACCRGKQK